MLFRKIRSAIIRAHRRLASIMRILGARTGVPGVKIPLSAVIGRGVRVEVTDGGNLTIGQNVYIGDYCVLIVRGGRCHIGDGVFIGHGCTIVAVDFIEIGRSSLLGEYTSVRDQDHRIDVPGLIAEAGLISAKIEVGTGVWIGARTTVLKDAQIGDGAVVGANSVVRGHLQSRSVNAGNPAKQIRMRL